MALSTSSSFTTATPTTSIGSSIALATPKLTTTFTPIAPSCTGNHLTMLANREFEIWMNIPVPVPGKTIADCYPDQFIQSFLSAEGGITQPAFNPLVCPQSYSAVGPYTSNYIACCPSGYSFAQPEETPFTDRPAYGGTCYTNIQMATPVVVTAYGLSGVTATTTFSATNTLAQAYAHPYEGQAFGVAQVASITPAASGSGPGIIAATGSPSIPASESIAAGTTYTVIAAAGPTFIPSTVSAEVGNHVVFEFSSGNHSLTQSTFNSPCSKTANGFDSGFMGNIAAESVLTVDVPSAQYFYSKQGSDCNEGMVFTLNPTDTESVAAFQAKAIAQASHGTFEYTSVAARVGIVVGCIVAFGCLLLIAFLFLRKRRMSSVYAEDSKGNSEYSKSFGGRSPTIPCSEDTRNYRNGLSPIDTTGSPVKPNARSIDSTAPLPPPKGEELHGFSSPSEMATYNQGAAAELPGSEGREYSSINEKHANHHQCQNILGSYHETQIHEFISPQSGGGQNTYSPNVWNEKSLGTFSSSRMDSTMYTMDSQVSPREANGTYENRL